MPQSKYAIKKFNRRTRDDSEIYYDEQAPKKNPGPKTSGPMLVKVELISTYSHGRIMKVYGFKHESLPSPFYVVHLFDEIKGPLKTYVEGYYPTLSAAEQSLVNA